MIALVKASGRDEHGRHLPHVGKGPAVKNHGRYLDASA